MPYPDPPVKLFVTGGAGFIGSNYVRRLLRTSEDRVTIYDALTYAGHHTTLRDVEGHAAVRFVQGDVCDRQALEEAMRGHDAVVHFAAESAVDRSIISPDAFMRTNCQGTNVVCDVTRRLDVDRLVHVSTDEVYGSVEEGSSLEEDPLDPRSPYSASKAGSDLIARSYFSTYGTPVLITRSSNNFGPYQYPEKVIPLFATNLIDGVPVPLYGDGMNVRDWCYVDDNCEAIDLVLRKGQVGQVYNIGAGNEVPNRTLVDKLLALFGADESMVRYVEDRPGHDRRYSVDSGKVASLGWSPAHDLDEALSTTVDWYRHNRWWWGPLRDKFLRSSA